MRSSGSHRQHHHWPSAAALPSPHPLATKAPVPAVCRAATNRTYDTRQRAVYDTLRENPARLCSTRCRKSTAAPPLHRPSSAKPAKPAPT